VVKQYTENQYDDDLTVGTDDYDDSYYTGSVDFFEFPTDEESPISRLKSLILSIDWEITDEILMQFNEELIDLRDIWANEKINLVYVQALEKISKYIYQKKANSHPSAIKLLLTLYHNLEKIVSSYDLTEDQKKDILLEDVKRFESLKRHISQQPHTLVEAQTTEHAFQQQSEKAAGENDLLNLKAVVLGIDWEITDEDLSRLRQEVVRLEEKFVDSRPKLILLQGIGTLGAYIKLKKSNAHADAFTLLHLFYDSLEKIVTNPMTLEEEKAILFPAVEKFNSFKILLGPTISAEAIRRDEMQEDGVDSLADSGMIAPAFADLPEEEVIGFQAEKEAEALGIENSGNIDSQVESFFTGSGFQTLSASTEMDGSGLVQDELQEKALQGVDVEFDDEDDFDELSAESSELSPALQFVSDEKRELEPSPAFSGIDFSSDEEQVVLEETLDEAVAEPSGAYEESDFEDENKKNVGIDFRTLDRDVVLQGVDVETEADDDSDEEALPLMGGELAPALVENDEVSLYNADVVANAANADTVDEEIAGTLEGFFDEEIESHLSALGTVGNDETEATSVADDSTTDEREIDLSDDLPPNLSLERPPTEKLAQEDTAEADEAVASFTMDEGNIPEEEPLSSSDEALTVDSEVELEESLNAFFDETNLDESPIESSTEGVMQAEAVSQPSAEAERDETLTDIDERLDSFFGHQDDVEESKKDILPATLPEEVEASETRAAFKEDIVPKTIEAREDFEEEEVVFELVEDLEPLPSDAESEIDSSGKDLAESQESVRGVDAYLALQTCVNSLGIELDNKVILGLFEEIEHLRQKFTGKPLEKTFLLLLATITRHIDKSRYDATTEAYVLLQSVCTALVELRDDDVHYNQEMLLTETGKVLQWQEDVLQQQALTNETKLVVGCSMPADQKGVLDNFDDYAETSKRLYQSESVQSTSLEKGVKNLAVGDESKIFTDNLQREISTLRQTLQQEIAELRKELKGD